MKRYMLVFLLALLLGACNISTPIVTPVLPTGTPTATVTPTVTSTASPSPTVTRTVTPTPTASDIHVCGGNGANLYEKYCYSAGQTCAGTVDVYGSCGAGFYCCLPGTGIGTPVITPTKPTPTPIATAQTSPVVTRVPPPIGESLDTPGLYSQYDYPCPMALVTGTLPTGERMQLCPNGLDMYGKYTNVNAFRTAGGMDWQAVRDHDPDPRYRDAVLLGGIFQTFWFELEQDPGVIRYDVIDAFLAGAAKLQMETPDGLAPKGVIVKISNSISQRPAQHYSVSGIDGGFVFDDLTPRWLKDKMIAGLPFAVHKLDGSTVAQDDGSYWVKMPCVFTDYAASHEQGSLWQYSLWVVPKYDNPLWTGAAKSFLQRLSDHYAGQGVTFLLGMGGMDGEFGNAVQDAYAGCEGIRNTAQRQYPGFSTPRDLPSWWNTATPAYIGYSSDVDPNLFIGLNLGLHQARITPDNPNYGGRGTVMWWPMQYSTTKTIAWENAYAWGTSADLYKQFSVAMMSFPRWFDMMGGWYWADKALLREFMGQMGRDIKTSTELWVKAYQTCYSPVLKCPKVDYVTGAWVGWPRNLEAGLTTVDGGTYVEPWTSLTEAQKGGLWASMLRRTKSLTLAVDSRWIGRTMPVTAEVKILDIGTSPIVLTYGGRQYSIARTNDGTYKAIKVVIGVGDGTLTLSSSEAFIWHGVSLWRVP